MANQKKKAQLPIWEESNYARVAPGRYSAIAVRTQGPEWIWRYQRWSLLLEFELLGDTDLVRVCAFFNMGANPARPHIGRQTRYFKAWTLANGELPRRGQVLDPDVFLDGQIYVIEIGDCSKDSKEHGKADAEIYSRATEIVSATLPSEVGKIKQPPNQAINQSRRPVEKTKFNLTASP